MGRFIWGVSIAPILALACTDQAVNTPSAPSKTAAPVKEQVSPRALQPDASVPSQTADRGLTVESDPLTPKMKQACGGCHAYPDPGVFTRRTWDHALPYVYRVLETYHGGDPAGVSLEMALDYYRRHAARSVAPPPHYPMATSSTYPTVVSPEADSGIIVDLSVDRGRVRAVDMLEGRVLTRSATGQWQTPVVGHHPVRALPLSEQAFLKGPFLIADLGIFRAADTDSGGVYMVDDDRRAALLTDVGRVSALARGDVTGDGHVDIVVAVFGWQSTGGLYVLEGTSDPARYTTRTLSSQMGYVDVALADLNRDGRLDIVAMLAQHIESIEVWNVAGTRPERQTIFKAPTPLWGNLGLTVVDLDGDGEQDILHWNGDTLDAPRVASFQGVHVLWQRKGVFTSEQLATLPGIHDVAVADLDGQGGLDFVAVANLPPRIGESLGGDGSSSASAVEFESVIQGLQSSTGHFEVSTLLRGQPCFSTVAVDTQSGSTPVVYIGSFGLGWSLFGHSGLHTPRDGVLCASGEIYRLDTEKRMMPAPGRILKEPTVERRITALQRIIENDPKDALNRVKLGNTLLANRQYQAAQDMFQEALEVDPMEKSAYLNLALVLDYRGRTNEAEGPLRDVLERYPRYADAHSQLSILLVKKGEAESALKHIDIALSISADQATFHLNRGAILAGSGRFSDAELSYQSALRLDPDNAIALESLQRIKSER